MVMLPASVWPPVADPGIRAHLTESARWQAWLDVEAEPGQLALEARHVVALRVRREVPPQRDVSGQREDGAVVDRRRRAA